MNCLPDVIIRGGDDTVVHFKCHALAWREPVGYGTPSISYGSFIGAGQALKVLRCSLSSGCMMKVNGNTCQLKPAVENLLRYEFRIHKFNDRHIHATLRAVPAGVIFTMNVDDMDEWASELMRVTSIPILPDWMPAIVQKLRALEPAKQSGFNCNPHAVFVDDERAYWALNKCVEEGAIELPECAVDMEEVATLNDYIRLYAEKMVESAGSTLRPLFDPAKEAASIPKLLRRPFRPQGWLIEAASRFMAS